jgi:hypothetical protein
MPSKTKRKYRGGVNLSNCEKWLDSINLSEKKDQCKQMETKLTFPVSAGTFGFGSKPLPPRALEDIGYIKKGSAVTNEEYWDEVYNKSFNPSAAPVPVVPSSYVPPQGRQLPPCTAYDRNTGKNVFLQNKQTNTYSERCDSSQLPKCSQWKSIDQGVGFDKKWATTGPNGEFCNVAELPMDNNLNYTFSKLNKQRDELVNMDKVTFPLKRYSTAINYGVNKYAQYNGGKRSRRKTRKSRR